MEQLEPRLR